QDLAVLVSWRALGRGTASCRHTLALAGGLRTPLESYEANLPVDLGDGSTDGLLRVAYQIERGSFYFTQMVGYELRGDDVPDGFPLQTTFGYAFGPVTPSITYALYTADGGTDIGEPGFTFPSNQDEYERLGLGLYARLAETWGLSAAFFDTLDGRNSGDLTGFSVGVVYRIR
ncbi:MAG: transporter, partial [Thermoanaerobaculia bacterium]